MIGYLTNSVIKYRKRKHHLDNRDFFTVISRVFRRKKTTYLRCKFQNFIAEFHLTPSET